MEGTAPKSRDGRRNCLSTALVSWKHLALLSCEKPSWWKTPPPLQRSSTKTFSTSSCSIVCHPSGALAGSEMNRVEASVDVTNTSRYPVAVVLVLGTTKRKLQTTCRFYQSRHCSTVAVRQLEYEENAASDVVIRIAIREVGRLLRAADMSEPQRAGHVAMVVHQSGGKAATLVLALQRQLDQFHDQRRRMARPTAFPPQIMNWNDGHGVLTTNTNDSSDKGPPPPKEHSRILGSISGKSSRRLLTAPRDDEEEKTEEEEPVPAEEDCSREWKNLQKQLPQLMALYTRDKGEGEDNGLVPYSLSKNSSAASAHTAAETLSVASTSSFFSFATPIVTPQSSQHELLDTNPNLPSTWYPASLLPPQYLLSSNRKKEEEEEVEDDDNDDDADMKEEGQEVVLQSSGRGSSVSTPPTTTSELTHCLPKRQNKMVCVGRYDLTRSSLKQETIGLESMRNDSRAFGMDMSILSSRLLRRGCVIYDGVPSRKSLRKSFSLGSLSKKKKKPRKKMKRLESSSQTSEGASEKVERRFSCLKEFGGDFLPQQEADGSGGMPQKEVPRERPLLAAFCAQSMQVRRKSRKEDIDRQLELLAGTSSSSLSSSYRSDDEGANEDEIVSRLSSPSNSCANVQYNDSLHVTVGH